MVFLFALDICILQNTFWKRQRREQMLIWLTSEFDAWQFVSQAFNCSTRIFGKAQTFVIVCTSTYIMMIMIIKKILTGTTGTLS